MNSTLKKSLIFATAILLTISLLLAVFSAAPANAASARLKAPKFVTSKCSYSYESTVLKWKKVKGAKKYQVLRSEKKGGKYKAFATTKKVSLSKKTTGNYYYKIRAVNGKKKSKLSSPVHLTSVNGSITNTMTFRTSFNFGGSSATTLFIVRVNNNSKTALVFDNKDSDYTVEIKNTKTGKIEKSYAGTFDEDAAITVEPGKNGDVLVRAGFDLMSYSASDHDCIVKAKFTTGSKKFTLLAHYRNLKLSSVPAITK